MHEHWPLTGRQEEVGVLAELLQSRQHRGVALAGRAGVGKTRLAREAASTAATSGWSVRYIAATATGRSIPLGAFAQWADEVDRAPLALARGVIGALTEGACSDRLLVFVDDAHLLDELSAFVLQQLVLQDAAKVIATIRSGEPAPDALTVLWKDGLLQRVELQPLSRNESDELLNCALQSPPDSECSSRLWRLTQGNVLYLRQLVEQEQAAQRLVLDDGECRWVGNPTVSPSLVEVVEHQIGAVLPSVRDVVDLVAVAEPVDRAHLSTLVDSLALEEAEERELIRVSQSTDLVYVGHPMYAEVRLNQCGPLRLRRLRGLVAGVMKDAANPADLVRRGLLWLESDLPPDPEVFRSAAVAASALLDFSLAERLFVSAGDAGVGAEERAHRAYNLLMLKKGDETAEIIDSMTSDDLPSSMFLNNVILNAANLLWTMRSPQQSWQVIDDALVGATGARASQLWAFRANQLALAGQPSRVQKAMQNVDYELLDDFGTTIGLCAETLALGELGRPEQAVAKANACYDVVDSTPQSRFLGQPLAEFHVFALLIAGCTGDAVEAAESHLRLNAEQPTTARTAAEAIVGMAALAAGDLPAALRHLPVDESGDGDFILSNSFPDSICCGRRRWRDRVRSTTARRP